MKAGACDGILSILWNRNAQCEDVTDMNELKKVICFNNYDEENIIFSNWYLSDFEIGGRKFSSLEQYMMYEKALLFEDQQVAQKVLDVTDAAEIKALGWQVKNYDEHLWNGCRQIVVYNGLMAKFSQNSELKERLLATGDAFLAECEPTDKIWGIGMALDDERCFDRNQWQGQNLLGYTLMQVRRRLREQDAQEAQGLKN